MSTNKNIFTSESVSEGHPDKVADQISDAILDALLTEDSKSRVACETLVKNNTVVLAGEITSAAKIDYEAIARKTIKEIGYNAEVVQYINAQSQDISIGVNENEGSYVEQGAGDQGIMFGFACNETEELMPLPISLSHRLVKDLADLRKKGAVNYLRPDAKAQVSVVYENGKPSEVSTVVLSTQHSDDVESAELEDFIKNELVKKVIPANLLTDNTEYFINPTGRFVIGGPVGDCGLTGRKIIVDTYGGYSRHGGGAFSGKDPSKVDRSATYMARYIAKNIVASGLADKAEVQLAYAIGVAKPVSVLVESFGTAKVSEAKISEAINKIFDLTPRGIIQSLDLLKPIYLQTAAYGHFGREASNGSFPWEKLDKVAQFKELLS
ncbi:UNVERIFIED_CONTAM: hypothetical protein GTU68_034335 [Idotea baltica]|nr:hypothetical protein [Idotea baltica]